MKYITKSERQIAAMVFELLSIGMLVFGGVSSVCILNTWQLPQDEALLNLSGLILGTFVLLLGVGACTMMLVCANTATIQHDIAKLSEQITIIQETLEIE